ncbi:MAG: PQQ-binding-like beta-propeller repeat protein [Polyangiaceae bacterium]
MTALRILNGTGALTQTALSKDKQRASVDLLVDGINLTARIPSAEPVPLLRDLALAIVELANLRTRRAEIRCYSADGPWEMGIERNGASALVSLFRGGAHPEIAMFERAVPLAALASAVGSAIAELSTKGLAASASLALEHARTELRAATILVEHSPPQTSIVEVAPDADDGLHIAAELELRERPAPEKRERTVERADLLGLLVRGKLRIGVGDRTRSFGDTFVFLFAEQLLALATEVLESWEQGRSYYRRVDLFGIMLGLRFSAGAKGGAEEPAARAIGGAPQETGLWISLGESRASQAREGRTFRLGDAPALVEATVAFGRTLARVLVRQDPSQRQNLRLTTFRRGLRMLDERLREARCDDAKVNLAPEIYRAFAAPATAPATEQRSAAKLRYTPVWTATFPGIDLRATFLCGDRLIVGASQETACVEKRSGAFLWRRPTQPAVSVVTPEGLARLFPDGSMALHDLGTGEISLTARLAPRVGGTVAGVVVSAPGLPRMLVVSAGKRCLSAVDLSTGEVRWRYSANGGSVFRLRRAGKLLIVAAGDATLTAIDLWTGDVVWRARDRLRFTNHVGLDHESLFASVGEPDARARGTVRLYHLDPYAGQARWVRELPAGPVPQGAPLVTDREVVVVTRDRRGLGLLALDRATGETRWSSDPGQFPVASAWIAIDGAIIVNSEAGDLFAVAANSGQTLWRHRFPRGMEGDQPRKLEPILRSGALFVPQQQVHVVRPRDGAVLGCVSAELIPDLLRVDEHCDVYVAEESGHLAAFRAGAKLSVV